MAIADVLRGAGIEDVVVCDRQGVIGRHRSGLPEHKSHVPATTDPRGLIGDIGDALLDAHVLVGVSGGTVREEHVARMSGDAVVFAMANPDPEVTRTSR